MYITTTKKMASMLNKEIKKDAKFKNYNVYRIEMSPSQFEYNVDYSGIFKNEADFDYNINKFKVIEVSYPDSYYANNKYITTRDLVSVYRNSNKTLEGFIKEFKNYIEI